MSKHFEGEQVYLGGPWAILPEALEALARGRRQPESREHLTATQAAVNRRGAMAGSGGGRIGILSIVGVIVPNPTWGCFIGCCAITDLSARLRQLVDDPGVASIFLLLDSPGGSVYSVGEFADELRAAGTVKPVTGFVPTYAASAAYWLGSQATALYAAPSAQVGSIGVIAAHVDTTQRDEMRGKKITTVVSSGSPYKNELGRETPLTPEARAQMQKAVDFYMGQFTESVAAGRGVQLGKVVRNFGQGRMLLPREARDVGMIDGVATLDEVFAKMIGRDTGPNGPGDQSARRVSAYYRPNKLAAKAVAVRARAVAVESHSWCR